VLTSAQVRGARAMLSITIDALAKEAGLTPWTIRRFENDHGGLKAKTQDKIVKTLERLGIILIEETDTTWPGILMRKQG